MRPSWLLGCQECAGAVAARALAHREGPYLIDLRCSPSLLAPLNKWEAV